MEAHAPGDFVSVLVATRGRPETLQLCLNSILGTSPEQFEVIVVDQSDEPAALPEDPRIHGITSATVGKSRALNIAIALARGDVLAFTDDDCTVPSSWLRRGLEVLQANPHVGLVFGALVAAPHDDMLGFIPTLVPATFAIHSSIRQACVQAGAGANMFARRKIFDAIKGFDERLGPGATFKSCEEFDLYYRTLSAGYAVAQDPDNRVTHWGIRSFSDGSGERLIRDYHYGEGAVLGGLARKREVSAIKLAIRTFYWKCRLALYGLKRSRTTEAMRAWDWSRGFIRAAVTSRKIPAPDVADDRSAGRSIAWWHRRLKP